VLRARGLGSFWCAVSREQPVGGGQVLRGLVSLHEHGAAVRGRASLRPLCRDDDGASMVHSGYSC
jgi:hypothetical protein